MKASCMYIFIINLYRHTMLLMINTRKLYYLYFYHFQILLVFKCNFSFQPAQSLHLINPLKSLILGCNIQKYSLYAYSGICIQKSAQNKNVQLSELSKSGTQVKKQNITNTLEVHPPWINFKNFTFYQEKEKLQFICILKQ